VPVIGASALLIIAVVVIAAAALLGFFHFRNIIRPPAHNGPIKVPGAFTVTGPEGAVISPDQARALVRAWWPMEEQALAQNDSAVIDAIETGPAAEYNDAVTRDNLVRGGNLRQARQLVDVQVRVPAIAQYPGYFFAEVLTTTFATADAVEGHAIPYQEFLVFVRPGASTPWKVALDTGGNAGSWPPFSPVYAGGTQYEDTPTGQYLYDPLRLPQFFATLSSRYLRGGRPPQVMSSIFQPGYWTSQVFEDTLKHTAGEQRLDLIDKWSFSADAKRDGFYQFAVAGDSNLVCFTLRYLRRVTHLGGLVVQDDQQDNWGGWLKPGRYRTIEIQGLRQTCALDPPSQRGQIQVFGGNGGVVDVKGG
jgi:hypothetical protein